MTENQAIANVVQVRVPHYPTYESARAALSVFKGEQRDAITSLKSSILSHQGTTKSNVDWSNPDDWISEKLKGEHLRLAEKIWKESKHKVNPRHITGPWLLASNYELLVFDSSGRLKLSDAGNCFQKNAFGEKTKLIDRMEGLGKILALVVEQGIASKKDLLPGFLDYLNQYSNIRAESTAKSYL
jgi:restriction system protein